MIAPARNLRPESWAQAGEKQKPGDCRLCANPESAIWQSPRGRDWDVKVIPNAYPVLAADNPAAYGAQELIINTRDHDIKFSELSVDHIQTLFEAYRRRLAVLREMPGIRYVLAFKNDGPLAGASLAHAHCQVWALPMVPPKIEQESDALNHYWDEHNTCAYCDIIDWEERQKVRVITQDKHWVAVSPYSATYAYEVWLIPRRHTGTFGQQTVRELHSLATILKKLTAKLDSAGMNYNYFLQESLPNQDHHFVIKVEPRTTKWGGAELGVGVVINPTSPEHATLWYQDKSA